MPRPACPSRNFAGTPFSPPPPSRLASRIPEPLSRSPTIRSGAATQTRAQTRAGTPTEAGLEPDWSRTSAARSRFRPPRPVRRSSRLRLRRQHLHTATTRQPVTSNPITAREAVASPAATATAQTRAGTRTAAGLYYKRPFVARHPSQPDNGMLCARCPSQPSTGPSSFLAALRSRTRALPPPSPPPSPRAGHKKNARTLPCGRRFHRKRENYFSFFSAFSIAAFRAARPAISPRVVFSTEALIFFTVDFVASAAARFSAFSAAISAFLASE